MYKFLCRLFIRDAEKTDSAVVREKYGVFAGIVGIIVNLLLSGGKLLTGLLTGSVAITADALNNMSDAGSSVISLISFRISAKPADRAHPFGHARMEYVASMIVSFFILLMGAQLLKESFFTLIGIHTSATVTVTWISVGVLAGSILFKLGLASFYTYVGKTVDSSVMRAAATDSLSDCISTAAVLVSSVVMRLTGLSWLDAAVGLLVAVLIIVAGVKILNDTKNSILGEAPVKETVENIRAIVARYPEAIGIHDLMIHNYGPHHLFATMHVEVDGSADIFALHDAMDNIERTVQKELGILCTIHMDPIVLHDPKVDALRAFVVQAVSEVEPDVTVHDFRAVIGTTHTNLIFDVVLPYESRLSPEEVKKEIEEKISEKYPDDYCVITVDRG